MCYCPTPTLHLNLALTGDGAFLFSLKKTHSAWFISILNYGDTENVLINHLLLVIPMSYPCHYTNLCPHKPHKHAQTHTHTHTHTRTRAHLCCLRPTITSPLSSAHIERLYYPPPKWMLSTDRMTMLESFCGSARDSYAVWKCHTPHLQLELLIKPKSHLQVGVFLLIIFLLSFCVLVWFTKFYFLWH